MKILDSVLNIKGIGDKTTKLFNKLGIYTIDDLLYFYPRTYAKYDEPIDKYNNQDGSIAIRLFILDDFKWKKVKNLNIGTGFATDGNIRIYITFFNTPFYKAKLLKGNQYIFYGKIINENNILKMEQPQFYTEYEYSQLVKNLQPIYSLTKGLSNKTIQKAIKTCIEEYDLAYFMPEYLSDDAARRFSLMSRHEALKIIHFPQNDEELIKAKKRLSFDELFAFLLMLRYMKGVNKLVLNKFNMIETAGPSLLIEKLPYRLTNAQIKAFNDIKNDMTGDYVMNRLIQGDVGSGKTIVSFLSLLLCVENGYQGALMAPTEILAVQHYENILELTAKYSLPFKAALITGSTKASIKKQIYDALNNGEINVVIGTHALIQEKVTFNKLGLVITDEQHRFGVKQRQSLFCKGVDPHVLVMSATPIPRTLAIVLYGDMHISVIDEKPAERLPIKNCVVNTSYRKTAYDFIIKQIKEGRQVYVICPMVEANDGLDNVENVIDYTEKLKKVLPNDLNIEYLHGKMKASVKNSIMNEFSSGNIDILVSTTVIEVGVDVPNSTVMLVENSERFGLSQLHQLRGRIGRGKYQSYAIFITTDKEPQNNKRLAILNNTNDGFVVAKEDLKHRGAGDIFGIRQSGEFNFEIADIYEDSDIIIDINNYFDELVHDNLDGLLLYKDYLNENIHKFIDFKTI